MTRELFFQAIIRLLADVTLLFLLIFLPAGTLDDWTAWLLMGILFIPMFILGFVMAGLNYRFRWIALPGRVLQEEITSFRPMQ